MDRRPSWSFRLSPLARRHLKSSPRVASCSVKRSVGESPRERTSGGQGAPEGTKTAEAANEYFDAGRRLDLDSFRVAGDCDWAGGRRRAAPHGAAVAERALFYRVRGARRHARGARPDCAVAVVRAWRSRDRRAKFPRSGLSAKSSRFI